MQSSLLPAHMPWLLMRGRNGMIFILSIKIQNLFRRHNLDTVEFRCANPGLPWHIDQHDVKLSLSVLGCYSDFPRSICGSKMLVHFRKLGPRVTHGVDIKRSFTLEQYMMTTNVNLTIWHTFHMSVWLYFLI